MMIKTLHRQAVDLTVLVLLNSRLRHEKCHYLYFLMMIMLSFRKTSYIH